MAARLAEIRPFLDERAWRLLLGAEARAIGFGGMKLVAAAAKAKADTVSRGAHELESGARPDGRVRAPGAGRPSAQAADPGLSPALEGLVAPETRGDPESALRWTTKSTSHLAGELTRAGHEVSSVTVGRLLKAAGYSLQGNAKTVEGRQHPDRDAQFGYINEQVAAFQATGDPVISVDAKKKELVGNFANKGVEWMPAGAPERVNVHDFADKDLGKATPYGVYDVTANTGWVNVGTDADTGAFAGGVDPPLVANRWAAGLSAGDPVVDHGGLGWVQRQPTAPVEDRAGHPRRSDRPADHGRPPAPGHVQVEPDRAPPVQPHLDELARAAAHLP